MPTVLRIYGKPAALILVAGFLTSQLGAEDQAKRPRITGIDHVRLYANDTDKSSAFYSKALRLRPSSHLCVGMSRSCFKVNSFPTQYGALEPAPSPTPKNWLAEVVFATDDVAKMRRYLVAHGVSPGAVSKKDVYGTQHFELRDPEGNPIAFVQRSGPIPVDAPSFSELVGARLLHAGFVVEDIAAENRFYLDLLGFTLYWYGGFKTTASTGTKSKCPMAPTGSNTC
jgi:catechol 2,3-dioxygenase-like lactoylglutathione lyase family enzyme